MKLKTVAKSTTGLPIQSMRTAPPVANVGYSPSAHSTTAPGKGANRCESPQQLLALYRRTRKNVTFHQAACRCSHHGQGGQPRKGNDHIRCPRRPKHRAGNRDKQGSGCVVRVGPPGFRQTVFLIFDSLRVAMTELSRRYKPAELAAIHSYFKGAAQILRQQGAKLRADNWRLAARS
jgi:hypothetical protein